MSKIIQKRLLISHLTAGKDRPYVVGLTSALVKKNVTVEFIGNDSMKNEPALSNPLVRYYNLRGGQSSNASARKKLTRVISYYFKLIKYATKTKSKLFHIQWFNKFILFDRTILNIFYKAIGKKIVFTAHNINAGWRDGNDTLMNRWSLRIMYILMDHIFVHTEQMKHQLIKQFSVSESKITVIPFGINNTVPVTPITRMGAQIKLGFTQKQKIVLIYGNIVPYKGVEIAVEAISIVKTKFSDIRLVIAGRTNDAPEYWKEIEKKIEQTNTKKNIITRLEFIPDEDTELYFKSADVLLLPYRYIFQSGVLSLAYFFGLPVIAADVGSLRDEIEENITGFVFKKDSPLDLAEKIEKYFRSQMYLKLDETQKRITDYAMKRYSWDTVADRTTEVYKKIIYKRRLNKK